MVQDSPRGPATSGVDPVGNPPATAVAVDLLSRPGLGKLAVLTFVPPPGRPATLSPDTLRDLEARLDDLAPRAADGSLAAVVVTGAGTTFAAGADLGVVAGLRTADQARELAQLGHRALRRLGELGVPTLAVLDGAAIGGGLEVALHCTYRVAGADVRDLALPEVALGLVPGWGGCTLLPALVGSQGAIELAIERPLAGRATDAAGALRVGLLDAVLPSTDLLDAAMTWLSRVLAGSVHVARREPEDRALRDEAVQQARARLERRLHGAAPAPVLALALIEAAPPGVLPGPSPAPDLAARDVAFAAEDDALARLLLSPELRAGLYAATLIRRAARSPRQATDGRTVASVGIVGAGLMATQIAVLVARRLEVPVRLRELDEERAAAGRARVAELVEGLRTRGSIDAATAARLLARVSVGTDLADLAAADLVIEAVTEVLEVKRAVLAELEKVVRPTTVLATNTSALSVTAMADGLAHPERVVGLHLFNPVERMPLIEVARATSTDEASLATAVEVARRLGKTPVEVADRPGFVVNRLLLRLLAEVADAVEDGAQVRDADESLDPLGLPMGPFALLDLVGLPVALHVLESLRAGLGERYPWSPGLAALTQAGRRVVGPAGSGAEHRVDPAIADAFGRGRAPVAGLDGPAVRGRVLAGLTDEVGRLVDERVVGSPQDLDLCLLLGAGWPWHLGGLCPYLDRTGWSQRVLGRRLLPPGVAD